MSNIIAWNNKKPRPRQTGTVTDWINRNNGRIFGASEDGHSLQFDGVDDFVEIPFIINPAQTSLTLTIVHQPLGDVEGTLWSQDDVTTQQGVEHSVWLWLFEGRARCSLGVGNVAIRQHDDVSKRQLVHDHGSHPSSFTKR